MVLTASTPCHAHVCRIVPDERREMACCCLWPGLVEVLLFMFGIPMDYRVFCGSPAEVDALAHFSFGLLGFYKAIVQALMGRVLVGTLLRIDHALITPLQSRRPMPPAELVMRLQDAVPVAGGHRPRGPALRGHAPHRSCSRPYACVTRRLARPLGPVPGDRT